MASKNLGAVIQRAISDGAFRRQLQSDPAAALRGFNLTPDEVAAIRSGDSGKLMSLGVDQRMSKAFTVGGGFLGATRATGSDLSSGGTASTIASDNTAGTREGIIGDPTLAGVRSVNDIAPFGSTGTSAIEDPNATEFGRAAVSTGDVSGTRAVNDVAPFGSTGTSAIEDPNATEFGRAAVSTGDLSGTRAVNDVAPFGATGTSAVEDASSPEYAASQHATDLSSARAVNDVAPFDGSGRGGSLAGDMSNIDNVAAADAGRGGSLADMTTLSGSRAVNDVAPFGSTGTSAIEDPNAPEGRAVIDAGSDSTASAVNDPYSGQYQGVSPDFEGSLSSRMADGGDATSIRPVNDVAPFEGNVNAIATDGGDVIGDARLDPGVDSSAADAASNTGETGDEHGWG